MRRLLQSRLVQTFLSVAVSGGLIVWALLAADLRQVALHLSTVDYAMLGPAVAAILVQFWLRAERWGFLLPQGRSIPFRFRFDAIMLGNFGNFLLPLRAGEFVRPFVLSRRTTLAFPTAFVSIILERFFDLSVVLIFFAFIVGSLDSSIPPGQESGLIADMQKMLPAAALMFTVLALSLFMFILLGSLFPAQLLKLSDRFSRLFGPRLALPLHRFVEQLLTGTQVLRRFSNLAAVTALSFAVWIITIAGYYVFFWLFADISGSIWLAFLVTVILALGVAAPSVPGWFGVYHGSCMLAFAMGGESVDKALAYAIVTHAVQYILVLLYGGYLLFRYGLRFGDLRKARQAKVEAPLEAPAA